MTNEQYLSYFAPIMPAFTHFHVTVKNRVVDVEARQVVLQAESTAMTALGEYRNEYVLVLQMTEEGGLVERFEEFVDSKVSVEFLPRLREYLEDREEREELVVA